MIVCICRAVSDRQIRSSLRDGAGTMKQLCSELGVGTCCGKCSKQVREMVDEHRAGHVANAAMLGCACAAA